ncbi:hypothetical protein O8W32_06660 [Methanomassiliicoccales archaeon LGM-DZ1]|nr:hypothetical protein O8W32_06660 [Methanomassiliicoccales archaeon LGM-DZ1]
MIDSDMVRRYIDATGCGPCCGNCRHCIVCPPSDPEKQETTFCGLHPVETPDGLDFWAVYYEDLCAKWSPVPGWEGGK